MLFDDINRNVDPQDPASNKSGGSGWQDEYESGAPAEREVPIHTDKMSVLLNQWLDGEVTAATVKAASGGEDAVDLWNKIHDETELLRSRTTPLYVHKRIMDSLPDDLYRRRKPWYRRSVALNPVTLVVAALALIGIGVAIAHLAAH
jgi:hypothetical protein